MSHTLSFFQQLGIRSALFSSGLERGEDCLILAINPALFYTFINIMRCATSSIVAVSGYRASLPTPPPMCLYHPPSPHSHLISLHYPPALVAQLSKFEEGGGLGISLEGTVDVEGGREVRPHHYIRSILPDGPVGKNCRLCSGDELLEVNGQKLLGLNHVEVVGILKELPRFVRLVCGRRAPGAPPPLHPIDAPTAERDTFAARRLVKAKSDGSLASSATAATTDTSFNRMKSRSLEPLTGLAMWSSECQVIELSKGDRGLGFSILDYQDPLNPQETVIVIRSLVPGGVAEKDGRLIPGDRLVAVNGTNLENATLDQAVAALKGAPKGTVSIAVAKPISVLESTGQVSETPDPVEGSEGTEGGPDPHQGLLGGSPSSALVKSESF
ncbi:Patj [Chionoecetes opilio]|uniref:Patj n=1 Tax=Chionoecetes opilio TaxID=41210 RepID=A0A8J4XYU3_CHIOP|nr:Patj [Chionoecetes opilio]